MDRRGNMEQPMKTNAMQAAVAQFLRDLQEGEGEALKGGGTPLVKVDVEAGDKGEPAECEACKAGTCDNAEHLNEESVAGLASAYGAE